MLGKQARQIHPEPKLILVVPIGAVYEGHMKPKHQNRRIGLVVLFGTFLVVGTGLILTALNQNLQFFYHPSEVLADGFEPGSETIKIGGLVLPGTVKTEPDLTTTFSIVDLVEGETQIINNPTEIRVSYKGVLPDLFSENESAVVTGRMIDENAFLAEEVLAKHDENYEPVKSK